MALCSPCGTVISASERRFISSDSKDNLCTCAAPQIGESTFELPILSEDGEKLTKKQELGMTDLAADALREIGESDIAMISASSIRAGLKYTAELSIPSSVKTDSQNNFIAAEGPFRVQDFMVSGEPWMSERTIRSR
jgi:hypothetical protein